MKIRRAVFTALAGTALTIGSLAAPAEATSRQAAGGATAWEAAGGATARQDTAKPKKWHNTGQKFYWYESCAAAGRAGVKSGWESYDCKGSSAPWSRYELWGLW